MRKEIILKRGTDNYSLGKSFRVPKFFHETKTGKIFRLKVVLKNKQYVIVEMEDIHNGD